MGGRGYADGSAHRILSDLSALALDRRLRLIVAADWNILRGYGEHGDDYWLARYDTVFSRAEALNLRFAGPEYPNGRRADPWPQELPRDSLCVPTFHHNLRSLSTATRQLDFVFASASLAQSVAGRTLHSNRDRPPPSDWRPPLPLRRIATLARPRRTAAAARFPPPPSAGRRGVTSLPFATT